MVGALFAGFLANTVGRKFAIATAAVPWFGSWLGIAIGNSFGVVLAARVLSGVAVGIASVTVPLYIAEIAPASLRGWHFPRLLGGLPHTADAADGVHGG